MKIYLDNIVFALQRAGGISVYWHELLKRMIGNGQDITLIERPEGADNMMRKVLDVENGSRIIDSRRPLILTRYLPLSLKMKPLSVFHSSYYRTTLQKDVVTIVTVHDFNYEHGLVRHGLYRYIHMFQKKYAVKKADGIICISENTKKDLLQFYKGIDENKIRVIYQAASDEYGKIDKADCSNANITKLLGSKYILYVATRSYHKNFAIAVSALKAIGGYTLVMVGGGRLSKNEIAQLDKELPNRYVQLNGINNDELNILYNYAFCLLYPSRYEGFGIPILEAMQAGCPVVTSNVSSIPEVCGGACLKVNKIEVDEFI